MAEFAYNNRQYSSTGRSLFLVNLGRHPNIYGEDKRSTQKIQEVDEFIQKIKEVRREVEEALKKTNKAMKWRTDKSRKETIEYKEGNLVQVDSSNISSDCPAKKLVLKRARPFSVIKKIKFSAYLPKCGRTYTQLSININ